jgi:hypothetical protein
MAVLRRSRKKPVAGDLFAVHFPTVGFIFGRAVFVDLPHGPMGPGSNLIYFYDDVRSTLSNDDEQRLVPGNLLIAPTFTNRLPWVRGYFHTIATQPITQADILPRHCFRELPRRGLVDLQGSPITEAVDPCGVWALGSYWTIDDALSDALGVPRAPE